VRERGVPASPYIVREAGLQVGSGREYKSSTSRSPLYSAGHVQLPIRVLLLCSPCAPRQQVPCSASRVVPGAHRVVSPGTHRGSGPRRSIRHHPEFFDLSFSYWGFHGHESVESAALWVLTDFCDLNPTVVALSPFGLFPAVSPHDLAWLDCVDHLQELLFLAEPLDIMRTLTRCLDVLFALQGLRHTTVIVISQWLEAARVTWHSLSAAYQQQSYTLLRFSRRTTGFVLGDSSYSWSVVTTCRGSSTWRRRLPPSRRTSMPETFRG
jgi:hypothetical protein